jgi:hypothetical protein
MTGSESITEKRMSPEAVLKTSSIFTSDKGDCISYYCQPIIGDRVCQLPEELDLPASVEIQAESSQAGFVIFCSKKQKQCDYMLIIPPFPITKTLEASYIETSPLLETLESQFIVGIVLVRMGSFAFGVSKGHNLVTSKVGKGLVHSRHRKGGSSANRFARHREKQIEMFFTRACGYLRQYFEPHVKDIDYMVYGGARTTILQFKKQCAFTAILDQPELPYLLDINEPRQAVLEQAIDRIWTSRVFTWSNES